MPAETLSKSFGTPTCTRTRTSPLTHATHVLVMAGRRRAPRILLPSVVALLVAALASPGAAAPVRRWGDTAVVESTIQEVYARPPADLLLAASNHGHAAAQQTGRKKHVKGGGKKDGKGYHHKQSAAGNDGYKHYDAFHTKSGDKYGYEQHSSFGKKSKGGKNEKYGAAHDAGFAGSHPDVEVVQHGHAAARLGPLAQRSQSLQDMSGDASVDHENTKYRRGLHDDDMFFVFSADGNENQDDGEGQQQQQQAEDDDDHDDDGEAAEQQEAADDDDEDDDGQKQQQQQQAEDDYDY